MRLRRFVAGRQRTHVVTSNDRIAVRLDLSVPPRRGGQGVVYRGWLVDGPDAATDPSELRAIRVQEVAGTSTASLLADQSVAALAGVRGRVDEGTVRVDGTFEVMVESGLLGLERADGTDGTQVAAYAQVMEWVDHSVADLLTDSASATPLWTTTLTLERVIPLVRALADCHQEGFVHGDIEPSNVMSADRGLVLIDWHVSAVETTSTDPAQDIRLSSVVPRGKPSEAAPEQRFVTTGGEIAFRPDRPANRATDAWQLGSLLCQLFLGRDAGPQHRTHGTVLPAAALNALPGAVGTTIKGLLEDDPQHRFTVAQAAELLGEAMDTTIRTARPFRRRRAAVAAASVAAIAALVVVLGPNVNPDGGEASPAQSSSSAQPRATYPVPVAPLPASTGPASDLDLSGSLSAKNSTTGTSDKNGHIEARPDDELTLTLNVTNNSRRPASGVVLYPRLFSPPDSRGLAVLDFEARETDDGPSSLVEGARLALGSPAVEACKGSWTFRLGSAKVSDGNSVVEAPTLFEYSPRDGESIDIESQSPILLPDVPPGAKIQLVAPVTVGGGDDTVQIDGTSVRFKVLDSASQGYAETGGIANGDTVRAIFQLHNGSCGTTPADVVLRAQVKPPGAGDDKTLLTARTDGGARVYPARTTFTPATLISAADSRVRLQAVKGSTRVYRGACEEPLLLGRATGDLLRSGVRVEVPGYVPDMTCESHIRWVTADFTVVPE